ncbi:unnamed protein product [Periconia digitata]|uniref:Uncharacterized protein n=1 Tax=Periconia digitata TaxID=1303443 RepID=A0A9W4UL52_9PLEO|nr:unnamed protein product [Periconia digitata]
MISLQSIALLVISYVVIPRLTFLPQSIHSILIIFGPFILPRLFQLFNTSRTASRSLPVQPTPAKVQGALNLLFLSAVVCIVLSLPQFGPENIFVKTSSRLQIETNTLFARLQTHRALDDADELLRDKFSTLPTNKLRYLVFGPDTLVNCLWCAKADQSSERNYFYYSLPKLATAHLAHLVVLGLCTSSLIGPEGSRFRIHATIAGLAMVASEAWYLGSYDIKQNIQAKTLQDIEFVHWKLRMYRYIAFALVDAGLGTVLWLTSTNRWLARPQSMAQRLEATAKEAEDTVNKTRALGLISNSVNRDQKLRAVREDYWRTEGQVMAETIQDEEVVGHINNALAKLDMTSLEEKVGGIADDIVSAVDGLRTSQILTSE